MTRERHRLVSCGSFVAHKKRYDRLIRRPVDRDRLLTFFDTLPVEVEAREKEREGFAGEKVLHRLRDIDEELLAAGPETLLALSDERII